MRQSRVLVRGCGAKHKKSPTRYLRLGVLLFGFVYKNRLDSVLLSPKSCNDQRELFCFLKSVKGVFLFLTSNLNLVKFLHCCPFRLVRFIYLHPQHYIEGVVGLSFILYGNDLCLIHITDLAVVVVIPNDKTAVYRFLW